MNTEDLGIIHALVVHLKDGNDPDELEDERLFAGRKNEILAKIEMVADENFGGDWTAFHTRMLTVIATAALKGENAIDAIEDWLDAEWETSGRLYI